MAFSFRHRPIPTDAVEIIKEPQISRVSVLRQTGLQQPGWAAEKICSRSELRLGGAGWVGARYRASRRGLRPLEAGPLTLSDYEQEKLSTEGH